jgi:hypothetical protein
LAALAVTDGSRSVSVPVAAHVARGTSASTLRPSPQALLNAALNAALGRLGGHLPGAAGIGPPTGSHRRPFVLPPSVQGFACPIASSGSCSATPCRLFTGASSVSTAAPVGEAGAIYEINALGTVRSPAHRPGGSTCSSRAPARALRISSTR